MSVRSSLQRFHISPYDKNAVMQLIAFTGVGFVAVHLVWITLIVYAVPEARAYELTFRYIGMSSLDTIGQRWWTIFTYGWCHHGFWEWLSNMLWLYLFGNVVQNLVGYKQIIPLFVYSIFMGGLAFIGAQLFPSAMMSDTSLIMGSQAGIMGLMAAGITLSPKYRIYFSDYFNVPLLLMAGIFVALILINSNFELAKISLLLGGALSGFLFVKLLQNGFQPGAWAYNVFGKMNRKISPIEYKANVRIKTSREEEIDKILDKINEKGFDALSKSEKDLLRETSR
jgi:membrane associated rhomboid family serine protease